MLQSAFAGVIVQVRPVGKVSLTATPLAWPGPAFETVTSNPIVSPAFTGPAGLAVFVNVTDGQFTVTDACAGGIVPPLVKVAVAVFWIVVQLAVVVTAWTCTR